MLTFIGNGLTRLRALGDKASFLGPALARLTVGLVFIGTGWGKLHSLADVTESDVRALAGSQAGASP